MQDIEGICSEPGQHPLFPGFYRDTSGPGNIGYVTRVYRGLVAWRGTKGHIHSALMGTHEFMSRFARVRPEDRAEIPRLVAPHVGRFDS